MKAGGGDSGAVKTLCHLNGEEHIGKLRKTVGIPPIVTLLPLEIIELARAVDVGDGAHGDDTRRCTLPEKSAEEVREKKRSKVIDGECCLKSVTGEYQLLHEHTGVMEEHIQSREPFDDLFAAGPHLGQRREIRLKSLDTGSRQRMDFRRCLLKPSGGPSMDDNLCTQSGKLERSRFANPVGRTGDKNRLAVRSAGRNQKCPLFSIVWE